MIKMSKKTRKFNYVEKQIRKKTFGILSTVSPKNRSHSTGILYGVSPQESAFCLYAITVKHYIKVRNIENNPYISFVIPFPHYYLRFVPSSAIYFQGKAEIVPYATVEAQKAFNKQRILKMMKTESSKPEYEYNRVFIRIKPFKKIFCYGIGMNIWQLRKNHEDGDYMIIIPPNRR
jgi:hypothetical protein